jgi:Na+/H+ antiporter NhaD/arsenite permease-like protein
VIPSLLPLLTTGAPVLLSPHGAWAIPFVLILLSIAVIPLISADWWGKHYPKVVLPLGSLVVIYYLVFFGGAHRMAETAHEYVSFIVLIGSLYIVSGGIHLGLYGQLTPRQNLYLLAVGAVLANFVGTTGASMILIRPFLRGNRWRFAPFHVVFFIFIVSNCGGALTPVGDPPLFLGYLEGVPFFWVLEHLWYKWIIAIGMLLAMFYVVDHRHYRRQPALDRGAAEAPDRLVIDGKRNFVFLAVILGAVLGGAYLSPAWVWLREVVLVGCAVASYYFTPRIIHSKNEFSFHPIQEVAILFAGIFAAMVPALDWLSTHAATLGLVTPTHFYWATGLTSSVLDNAPAYLTFLTTALGLEGKQVVDAAWIASHTPCLQAISVASVFFGAATYIGNGPNFMVKSICEHAGAATPSFIEYIYKYTLPVLVPVLIVTYFLVRAL